MCYQILKLVTFFFHENTLGQHWYKLIFLLKNMKLFVVCTGSIYIKKILNMSILSHAIIKILRWQNYSVIFLKVSFQIAKHILYLFPLGNVLQWHVQVIFIEFLFQKSLAYIVVSIWELQKATLLERDICKISFKSVKYISTAGKDWWLLKVTQG